ncbi:MULTISPECIES: ABC transporter ATP-binding protein [unclassified Pannonibacter]|uniref:ABC transporter ATP-binding protein n=1 Tax=unclassified Pannonibacter TaxID=2627228 RepID=UPI001648FA26|nr:MULTISPECIES: ABC transporter ATP-binding protein [unclassified Pannonibacter]
MTAAPPLVATRNLMARYGDFQALFSVNFNISAGETVALIGANGAGKSTFLRALMGLLPVDRGMVLFEDQPVGGSQPHHMVQLGVAMVPEGRRLFAGMSVEDNLRVAIDHARKTSSRIWTLERIYKLFPVLRERRSAQVEKLSGGQQQMVAIGRALLAQPRLLLCDEISLGLAPKVIREIYEVLPEIARTGTSIVLVEQDVMLAQSASNRLYCMLEGHITLESMSCDVTRADIAQAYFGAGHEVA